MQSHIGTSYTDQDVKEYLWSTLKSGQVVPGYGHAVLRKPDPRFEALIDFASARPEIARDPVFQLVKKNSEIAPGVLMEHGKVCFTVRQTQSPYLLVALLSTDQEPAPERRLVFRGFISSLRLS